MCTLTTQKWPSLALSLNLLLWPNGHHCSNFIRTLTLRTTAEMCPCRVRIQAYHPCRVRKCRLRAACLVQLLLRAVIRVYLRSVQTNAASWMQTMHSLASPHSTVSVGIHFAVTRALAPTFCPGPLISAEDSVSLFPNTSFGLCNTPFRANQKHIASCKYTWTTLIGHDFRPARKS